MAEPYAIPNETQGALASEFVLGTDNHAHLVAIGLFDAGGGHLRIKTTDGVHWCLITYTGVSTNDLTGLTQVGLSGQLYSTGDGAYTFPAASIVERAQMGEDVSKRIMGPASATDGDFFQADGTTGKKAKGGLSFKDEDDMASNSDVAVPSQQSVKAYADRIGAGICKGYQAKKSLLAGNASSGQKNVDVVSSAEFAASMVCTIKDSVATESNTINTISVGGGAGGSDRLVMLNNLAHTYTTANGAFVGAAQSLANTTFTQIELNAEVFDPDSRFNVANDKWVCPSTGYYLLIGFITYEAVADNTLVICELRNNGAAFARGRLTNAGTDGYPGVLVTALAYLAAADEITMWGYHSSGTAERLYIDWAETTQDRFVSLSAVRLR